MDTVENYRQIIETVLTQYTKIPYAYGDMQSKTIFDREADSYLLVTLGWNGIRRVHGCLVHIDIIDGKVWLQRDDTDYGIAYELENAGIPKKQIVLGFQSPEVRPFTQYAVA
ncbi:MAG: XisI protein [Anaerolineae bacterium]